MIKNYKEFYDVMINSVNNAKQYLKGISNNDKISKQKDSESIVTNIDIEVESIIIDTIKKSYHSHSFLTEEHGTIIGDKSFRWIIDPIDGTNNFVHDIPYYAVCISLEIDDNTVTGCVYNPKTDELLWAINKEGAYLNNKRIYCSKINKLSECIISFGIRKQYDQCSYDIKEIYFTFHKKCQAMRRCGSTALDICRVAQGQYDGFWGYGGNLWDVSAANLIVVESGGKISNFEGSSYNPDEKLLIACNGLIQNDLLTIVKDRIRRT